MNERMNERTNGLNGFYIIQDHNILVLIDDFSMALKLDIAQVVSLPNEECSVDSLEMEDINQVNQMRMRVAMDTMRMRIMMTMEEVVMLINQVNQRSPWI